MKNSILLIGCTALSISEAFVPSHQVSYHAIIQSQLPTSTPLTSSSSSSSTTTTTTTTTMLNLQNTPESEETTCWNPQLRRIMGGIASLGAVETSYLTWNKLQGSSFAFCGVDGGGSCNDVLNGPYAYIPFTEVPLSAVGLMAYLTVAGLALFPLLSLEQADDTEDNIPSDTTNRMVLMGVTTAMGTFSIFLLTLLFGVLQQDCPYCELSATFSILLALLAGFGGCLPEGGNLAKKGAQMTASGFLTSTAFAVSLFVFAEDPTAASATDFGGAAALTTFLSENGQKKMLPPPITTDSSDRALSLATELQALDAKMFGAFWCSHCIDQKETLGKQAFTKIPYVECSKEGMNAQTSLCKKSEVPGYPTWKINGKLYPGEQSLEELEEVVAEIKKGATGQ